MNVEGDVCMEADQEEVNERSSEAGIYKDLGAPSFDIGLSPEVVEGQQKVPNVVPEQQSQDEPIRVVPIYMITPAPVQQSPRRYSKRDILLSHALKSPYIDRVADIKRPLSVEETRIRNYIYEKPTDEKHM